MANEIAATIGVFDGVHRGHQALIYELISIAIDRDLTPCVITFAHNPSSIIDPQHSPYLLTTISEKIERLKFLGIDDTIVLEFNYELAQLSAKEFLYRLKNRYNINTILMGHDHKFGSDRLSDIDKYKEIGKSLNIDIIRSNIEVVDKERISSSIIRHLITSYNVQKANVLLGYPYTLKGRVVEGMKIGRTMGYPTANIEPIEADKLLPSHGVYAVFVRFDSGRYPAMLYIGRRPTMDDGRSVTIEANIFDMNIDLYEKNVEVEFIKFTRGDCRFKTLKELKKRIEEDEREIREILGNV